MHQYIITNGKDRVNAICYNNRKKKKKAYKELLELLSLKKTPAEWDALLRDLLTPQERDSLAERWQIIQLLDKGMPQREIADLLQVSISKITRGSRALLDGKGGFENALKVLQGKK